MFVSLNIIVIAKWNTKWWLLIGGVVDLGYVYKLYASNINFYIWQIHMHKRAIL